MTRTVLELVAVLTISCVLSVVSLFVTAILLSAARTDLGYIYEEGIGNGRRAAARGEHRMAWARFLESIATTLLTGLLVYIGIRVGISSTAGPEWTIHVLLVAFIDALICFKAIVATRTRARIYELGAHGDLSPPPARWNSTNGR